MILVRSDLFELLTLGTVPTTLVVHFGMTDMGFWWYNKEESSSIRY